MKYFIQVCIVLLFISCGKEIKSPKAGAWRAVLLLDDSKELPFLFQYNADNSLVIFNAEEEIEVSEVTILKDSITIKMPVFEGIFKGTFTADSISGNFITPSLDRVVPFVMKLDKEMRFPVKKAPTQEITGVWETVFSPDTEADRYVAKGVFEQIGNKLTGTFRTTTGDYRYLDGIVEGDSLKLSTFDGAHAFLFEAEVKDSVMNGTFYSGNHFKEPFTAKRNEAYELPSEDSLTFLKEGYERIEFSFPNTEGELVSLNDPAYKNKVVIVQIMGSWCPNCLDETKYYTSYYGTKSENVEFISLAFEYAKTKEKALTSINRLKEKIGIPYPILLAQYGTSDKKEANKKLPMLTQVLSYPTTIFIDKKGIVRKIHTGFNGPATGEKYTEFKKDFETFVALLANEE